MFEDIVICEMYHSDPLGNEYCNPEQIAIGKTHDNAIMVSLVFKNPNPKKAAYVNGVAPLQISVETLDNDKIDIKDKYDVQEAVKISITDTIEIYDMIIGSSLLCYVAMQEVGGFSGLHNGLASQDANLTSIVPADLNFGVSLWIFAFFLGGLSVAGQPQVVTRVMTLGSDEDRKTAMLWFFAWQTPFLLLMVLIGLASRVVFTGSDFDPELGLPMLAMETLGPF